MLEDTVIGRSAARFNLQWHVTHACDLACKHCYDRTRLSATPLDQCLRTLDDLGSFSKERGVQASVTLTGGNPFLHPRFFDLCREVAASGFPLSILGNPVSRDEVRRLVAVARPTFFQVSLEGLCEHNDSIRGPGTFQSVLDFLPVLREEGISPIVMTTLTRDNLGQIVPLARLLGARTDRATFTRLARVGEGAALTLPTKDEYGEFAMNYLAARRELGTLGLKDNLLNIVLHALGQPLSGGCTGFGCGAAFNFVAVLPNAEVHACRKFPSRIGSLLESRLSDIWDSPAARRHRRGCAECDGCPIRKRCGGCLAVAHGEGLDPSKERDPHCFIDDLEGFRDKLRAR
ncbi:MAG: selenobiotic family peptide radical SAM maturase [Deltaproteobacteria bacterium]|nr:selenobiotic family peptide radical SAM maturase [Deltaproteobacteria bacterium]